MSKSLATGVAVLAMLTALTAAWAGELSIKTSAGKGADTYVHQGTADANYGGAALISVAAQPTVGRKGYIRFDLSDVKEPIKGAVLYLTVGQGTNKDGGIFNVFGLNDGADDTWAEGKGKAKEDVTSKPEDGINWTNAPANDPKRPGGPVDKGGGVDKSKATFLGKVVVVNTGYALNNKPQAVAFGSQEMVDFLNKDTNKLVTFILTRENTSQTAMAGFVAKEDKNGDKLCPVLKVSSEPLPFPVQPEPVTTSAPAASKPADAAASKPAGGGKKKGS